MRSCPPCSVVVVVSRVDSGRPLGCRNVRAIPFSRMTTGHDPACRTVTASELASCAAQLSSVENRQGPDRLEIRTNLGHDDAFSSKCGLSSQCASPAAKNSNKSCGEPRHNSIAIPCQLNECQAPGRDSWPTPTRLSGLALPPLPRPGVPGVARLRRGTT